MKAILVLAVVVGLLGWPAQPAGLQAAVTPAPRVARAGQAVVATVAVQVPAGVRLGSYTAELRWNPRILRLESTSGVPAGWLGVVNEHDAAQGVLIFNGARAAGSAGNVELVTVRFTALRAGLSSLSLRFSAMAAAESYADLLPALRVRSSWVVVHGR